MSIRVTQASSDSNKRSKKAQPMLPIWPSPGGGVPSSPIIMTNPQLSHIHDHDTHQVALGGQQRPPLSVIEHPFSPSLLSMHLSSASPRLRRKRGRESSASSSSFNPNSGVDGFVSILGARNQNEDKVQTFISRDPDDPRVYCVHDGHGGIAAVNRLCAFMDNHSKWISCTESDDKMHFLGDMYMEAIRHLKKEISGVVSITAFCDKEAVYFAWVGDCEGAIFNANYPLETGPICQTTSNQYIDYAEIELVCKTNNKSKMPSFISISDEGVDTSSNNNNVQAVNACTSPHSLMASNPILALEHSQMSQMEDKQKALVDSCTSSSFADSSSSNENCTFCHVQLSAKPHSMGNQTAQREYELAQIQSENPLLQIEVSFIDMIISNNNNKNTTSDSGSSQQQVHRRLLTDARFDRSIQPTRALGDCDITASFGTLRYPSVMKIPLDSLLSGGKRVDDMMPTKNTIISNHSHNYSNNVMHDGQPQPPLSLPFASHHYRYHHDGSSSTLALPHPTGRYIVLCSDGPFSNGAFADMSALTYFLVSPLLYFKKYFYHMKQELTLRLMQCKKMPYNMMIDSASSYPLRHTTALMDEWQACKTWKEVIIFIKTHHFNAVCGHSFQKTFFSDPIEANAAVVVLEPDAKKSSKPRSATTLLSASSGPPKPPSPPLAPITNTTTSTTSMPQNKKSSSINNVPYSMNLQPRNFSGTLPPYFASLSSVSTPSAGAVAASAITTTTTTPATTTTATNFAATNDAAAALARQLQSLSLKNSTASTSSTTIPTSFAPKTNAIITDDTSYLAWRTAFEASVEWLVLNVGIDEPTVQTLPLHMTAMAAAHMAVVMGSYDNVTILVASLD